jgi:GTPase KRas
MAAGGYSGSYKIVILGGGAVGKSALTVRLITDNFLDDYDPTIEELYMKTVNVDDNVVPIEVLDTAGQEEFLPMQDEWIRNSKGFLLVYSVTDRASFEGVPSFREKILRIKEGEKYVPIVLAGNKCDLDNTRQVSVEEGSALSKQWKCPFFETSAKMKINNTECFYELVREMQKADNLAAQSANGPKRSIFSFCNLL